jgi:hypothetical protein
MDCCAHGYIVASQPWMWRTPLASVGATLAGEAGPRGSTEAARIADTTAAALAVLRNSISVDVHSHGGKTGVISKALPSSDLADAMNADRWRPPAWPACRSASSLPATTPAWR